MAIKIVIEKEGKHMNDKEITETAMLLAKDRIHNFIVENLTANQIRELLRLPPIESQKNER